MAGPFRKAAPRMSQSQTTPGPLTASVLRPSLHQPPAASLTVRQLPDGYREEWRVSNWLHRRGYRISTGLSLNPGTIIRKRYVEEHLNQTPYIHPADHTKFQGPNGMMLYMETRIFIVVRTFVDHYVALPLYTWKGCGLSGSPDDDFLSVFDHRDPASHLNQRPFHPPLWTDYMHPQSDCLHLKSMVWYSCPKTIRCRTPVELLGRLVVDSTIILQNYYHQSRHWTPIETNEERMERLSNYQLTNMPSVQGSEQITTANTPRTMTSSTQAQAHHQVDDPGRNEGQRATPSSSSGPTASFR